MKHIYLNLKRFDVPVERGGVNRLAPVRDWGAAVVNGTQEALKAYDPAKVEGTFEDDFVNGLEVWDAIMAASRAHSASAAREQGVVVVNTDRRKLDAMSRTHAHQGVIALAAVREYASVDDILAAARAKIGRASCRERV